MLNSEDGLPPLPTYSLARLHHALLSESSSSLPPLHPTTIVSPTLAILRLAMLSQQKRCSEGSDSPDPRIEAQKMASSLQEMEERGTKIVEWREQGMKLLEAAGQEWAAAGRDMLQVQTSQSA